MGPQEPLDALPTAGVPVLLEGVFYKAQQLIGHYGDKDMALNTPFDLVVLGPEALVALEGLDKTPFGPQVTWSQALALAQQHKLFVLTAPLPGSLSASRPLCEGQPHGGPRHRLGSAPRRRPRGSEYSPR